eukprot:865063-Amphidinium_carterae.1
MVLASCTLGMVQRRMATWIQYNIDWRADTATICILHGSKQGQPPPADIDVFYSHRRGTQSHTDPCPKGSQY